MAGSYSDRVCANRSVDARFWGPPYGIAENWRLGDVETTWCASPATQRYIVLVLFSPSQLLFNPWLRFISLCSDTYKPFVGTSPSIFSALVRRNDLVFLMRCVSTGHNYDTCFLSIRFLTASGLFSSLAAMWTKLCNEVIFGRFREIAKSDY